MATPPSTYRAFGVQAIALGAGAEGWAQGRAIVTACGMESGGGEGCTHIQASGEAFGQSGTDVVPLPCCSKSSRAPLGAVVVPEQWQEG